MPTAILQHSDTGAIESMKVMMDAIGWQLALPSSDLKSRLRYLGCDTVCNVETMVKDWGYDAPCPLPECGLSDLARVDVVFMDVKAHRNVYLIHKQWPQAKVIWHRVNGSMPENVPGKGEEINPPVPVLTPNLWYRGCEDCNWTGHNPKIYDTVNVPEMPLGTGIFRCDCRQRFYAYWPPFMRFEDYYDKLERPSSSTPKDPICLINGVLGWGYGAMVESARALGVKCYGLRSPDGLVNHAHIPEMLARSLAMVHLKSNDAPGYALYEALAAACPIVLPWQLINRCKMHDLFIPGETCLTFDENSDDWRSSADVPVCTKLLKDALERLRDPLENQRIGMNGHNKLLEVMWSNKNKVDVNSLTEFMNRLLA